MPIKIVKLSPNQWSIYKSLRLETLKQEPQAFSSKHAVVLNWDNDKWIKALTNNNNYFLVALETEEPVGIIRLTINDAEESKDTAIIGSFYVKKIYRGNNIGSSLMKHSLDVVKTINNIAKVRLYVKPSQKEAIELYKKFEFELIGEKNSECIFEKQVFRA